MSPKHYIERRRPKSWHCDSHKSMFSTICCLTLLTASGELQFWESPEEKFTVSEDTA